MTLRAQDRFEDVDLDKEAIIQAETDRKNGVKGVVDVRITSETDGLDLRDLFLNYKSDSDYRLTVGQAKKRFGLEWDYNLEDILTLTRTILFRRVSDLNYTGRDTLVAYQSADDKELGLNHNISLHTSEGLNAAFLYRLMHRLDEESFLASYTMVQRERISSGWTPLAGAQSFAYSGIHGHYRLEAELQAGKDQFETKYNQLVGRDRNIYFSGLSAGLRYELTDLKPFIRATIVLHDLGRLNQRATELKLGAKYHFHKRFFIGTEGALRNSRYNNQSRLASDSYLLFTLRYFYG